MIKYFLIVIIYFSFSLGLFAQGESDWWYFGVNAGIHFTQDSVDVVYDGALIGTHTNFTQADENGNLLFYTNGSVVYSRNHEVMENGGDIDLGTGLGCITMKIGVNDSVYYLLYLDYIDRLFYKTININANNGLGIVSDAQLLSDSAYYHITATKKANGIDYWVVCRKVIGNKYISYSLTEQGLDTLNIVYSNAGESTYPAIGLFSDGHLRINPQGNLLAFSLANDMSSEYGQGRCELFYFNNVTGKVDERIIKLDDSNVISQNPYHFIPHSTEFSSDGEKMYISGGWVFQCNIALLDSASIIQSMVRFNEADFDYFLIGLQLAKDGRIYIGNPGNPWLSVIHHPNIAGLGAGFSFNGLDHSPVTLNTGNTGRYLPNFESSLFSSGFTVANRCVNTQTQFSLIYDMEYSYVHWDFGDGNTSLLWEPVHVFENTGTYTVNLTTAIGGDTTNKSMDVIIEGMPSVNLGLDGTLVCDGDSLLLDASFYGAYYRWQDNSYQATLNVKEEGEYFVEVKNICGVTSDTIKVVLDKKELNIGEDTLICIQEPLLLQANQTNATAWLWQDGSTLPFYQAENTGQYYVLVTTPCFFINDSISVETEDCAPLIPTIFTPNNDGINDTFEILNLEIIGYKWSLEVYNRWGKQVYYSNHYQNNWKAKDLSDGVYFYILRSLDTPTSYRGSVTVVR
jgi:gliding motility-associated-like protein